MNVIEVQYKKPERRRLNRSDVPAIFNHELNARPDLPPGEMLYQNTFYPNVNGTWLTYDEWRHVNYGD